MSSRLSFNGLICCNFDVPVSVTTNRPINSSVPGDPGKTGKRDGSVHYDGCIITAAAEGSLRMRVTTRVVAEAPSDDRAAMLAAKPAIPLDLKTRIGIDSACRVPAEPAREEETGRI